MRTVKRWLRRRYAGSKIGGRRAEIEARLGARFGMPVTLTPAGARGRDSIYLARGPDRVLGVLRLSNPHLRRTPPPAGMPFVATEPAARLDREWACYETGHRAGLTPRPIWRTHDALLCEYVPGTRMSELLAAAPADFWPLICRATRALRGLHAAGLTHMDACLANILRRAAPDGCTFIDFEYGPAAHLSEAQQRAYDYLRLVESSIKFLRPELRSGYRGWLRVLGECIDSEARNADPGPLGPGLGRLWRDPEIGPAVRVLFPHARR